MIKIFVSFFFQEGYEYGMLSHRSYPHLYEFQLLNIC